MLNIFFYQYIFFLGSVAIKLFLAISFWQKVYYHKCVSLIEKARQYALSHITCQQITCHDTLYIETNNFVDVYKKKKWRLI